MDQSVSRYKKMEHYMTLALIADATVFVAYLMAAGAGIIWLKVVMAIIAFLISGLCLAFLYVSKELTKPRSIWMTTAAIAVALCLLVSLIAGFPAP